LTTTPNSSIKVVRDRLNAEVIKMKSGRFTKREFALLCVLLVPAWGWVGGQVQDNQDGTFTDLVSGHTWIKPGSALEVSNKVLVLDKGALVSVKVAAGVLSAMNEAESYGLSCWRASSVSELKGLLNLLRMHPKLAPDADLSLLAEWLDSRMLGANAKVALPGILLVPVADNGGWVADAVILATNSAYISSKTQVISGNVVVNDVSAGPTLATDSELTVGPHGTISAGAALKADSIRVQNRTVVDGDLFYNELVNKGTINGNEHTPLALPVYGQMPLFFSYPADPGAEDVLVPDQGFVSLDEGEYGHLQVGTKATLVLTGGAYRFNSITSEPFSTISIVAASSVTVADKMRCENTSYVGPALDSGITAAEIVFYVSGVNGEVGELESEPKAVQLGPEAEIYANFYAPYGTILLQPRTNATGAFLAQDVMLANGSTALLDSFFFNLPPVAVDDALTVETGTIATVLDSGESSLLANDSDPNGDGLTVSTTPVVAPGLGVVELFEDGQFAYTAPVVDEVTSDSFVYEVCDDGAPQLCATATVHITITEPQWVVNVIKVGSGDGLVTSNPVGIDCGDDCEQSYEDGTEVSLSATPDSDSKLIGVYGSAECSSPSFMVTRNVQCFVRFDLKEPPPEYAWVTVLKSGDGDGLVRSQPDGIYCGQDCTSQMLKFKRVNLYVYPNEDSRFVGWSGDSDCLDGMLGVIHDTTCTAVFELLPPPPPSNTLQVAVTGSGSGIITSNPGGIVCVSSQTCSADYEIDTVVRLFARPDNSSFYFAGFSGDPDCADGFITMSADKACTATFEQY
jgi:hypothetical protein